MHYLCLACEGDWAALHGESTSFRTSASSSVLQFSSSHLFLLVILRGKEATALLTYISITIYVSGFIMHWLERYSGVFMPRNLFTCVAAV